MKILWFSQRSHGSVKKRVDGGENDCVPEVKYGFIGCVLVYILYTSLDIRSKDNARCNINRNQNRIQPLLQYEHSGASWEPPEHRRSMQHLAAFSSKPDGSPPLPHYNTMQVPPTPPEQRCQRKLQTFGQPESVPSVWGIWSRWRLKLVLYISRFHEVSNRVVLLHTSQTKRDVMKYLKTQTKSKHNVQINHLNSFNIFTNFTRGHHETKRKHKISAISRGFETNKNDT